MSLQKTHRYEISRAGVFLGVLQDVTSDFTYSQPIASIGTQVIISVGQSANVITRSVEAFTDEAGDPITDESDNPIISDGQPNTIGDSNEDNLIRNHNTIKVIEFSSYHPNGVTVFEGYISKWKAVFGGGDDIEITCLSEGQDTQNFLVQTGDSAYITQSDSVGMYNRFGSPPHDFQETVIQTFTMPLTKTVSAITVQMSCVETGYVSVIIQEQIGASPDLGNDPTVASGTVLVTPKAQENVKIGLNASTDLSTGTTYYFRLSFSGNDWAYAYGSSSNPYANGTLWLASFSGTTWGAPTQYSSYDMYFILWEFGGSLVGSYTSEDPTFMLTSIMEDYANRGGHILIPPSPVVPYLSQIAHGSTVPSGYWSCSYAQIFTPTADTLTNLIQLYLGVSSGSCLVGVAIYEGDPSGDGVTVIGGVGNYDNNGSSTLIATATPQTITNTTAQVTTFEIATPVTLQAGHDYFLLLFFNQGGFGTLNMYGAGSSDLPITATGVGQLYIARATFNNSSFSATYSTSNPALYFGLAHLDPVPDSLAAGYADTGVSTDYDFKYQTIKQAIEAIVSLAPEDWYWYVEPADSTLYFQPVSATADHTLVKGRHINLLEIEATKENIANRVYFTGGPTAGVNTFVKYEDAASLAINRVGLKQLTDNHVTDDAVALLIAQNYSAAHSAEEYITPVTILDQTIDTTLFHIGETIGFQGFGNFVDDLILQIVGKTPHKTGVTLSLGVLPKKPSGKVEEIRKGLTDEQTIDNPDTPT